MTFCLSQEFILKENQDVPNKALTKAYDKRLLVWKPWDGWRSASGDPAAGTRTCCGWWRQQAVGTSRLDDENWSRTRAPRSTADRQALEL